MRNKYLANYVTLGVLVALLLAVGGVSRAFDDQAQPPPTAPPTAPPVTPPPASPDEVKEEKEMVEQGEGKSTERFTPSQRTSADNSASFPVDI